MSHKLRFWIYAAWIPACVLLIINNTIGSLSFQREGEWGWYALSIVSAVLLGTSLGSSLARIISIRKCMKRENADV